MNPLRYPLQRIAGIAVASLALAALPRLASAESGPGFDDPNNWPQYHRSYNAWRFSPLDQINKSNVKKLKVAWIMQPGNITHGLQATPIEIDGVMYLISADNHVWALDAATGKAVWDFQPKLDPVVGQVFYRSASRGVTVGRGKVFVGTLDGRFLALDQKTGKQVWEVQLTKPKEEWGALFSAPPQLAGNVLFGGTTGGDQPGTGKIYGLDLRSAEERSEELARRQQKARRQFCLDARYLRPDDRHDLHRHQQRVPRLLHGRS
jgi:alcohol dehydrogenase (cytochrome c)